MNGPVTFNLLPMFAAIVIAGFWVGAEGALCVIAGAVAVLVGIVFNRWLERVTK